MIHGWLNLYKPQGITSSDTINLLRRKLRLKKVGHAGTLDKLACGVLPIAIGEGTKIVSYVMNRTKEYIFTIRFGESRTTDDLDGEITETSSIYPTYQQIQDILPLFHGEIQQIPPKYSALKIGGRRSSDLMREGQDVTPAPRLMTIFDFELLSQSDTRHFTFRVDCSKGFYIRSFARDIAASLGMIGCVSYLERSKVGAFQKENAISVEKLIEIGHIDGSLPSFYSIKAVLDDIPAVLVSQEEAADLRQGRSIPFQKNGVLGDVLCLEDGLELGIAVAQMHSLSPKRNFVY